MPNLKLLKRLLDLRCLETDVAEARLATLGRRFTQLEETWRRSFHAVHAGHLRLIRGSVNGDVVEHLLGDAEIVDALEKQESAANAIRKTVRDMDLVRQEVLDARLAHRQAEILFNQASADHIRILDLKAQSDLDDHHRAGLRKGDAHEYASESIEAILGNP